MVVVQDATEHIPAAHWPLAMVGWKRDRTPLVQALMRATLIVEGDIFGQHALQVALVEDQAALDRRPPSRVYERKLDGAHEARLIALAWSAPPAGQVRWPVPWSGKDLGGMPG